jgi:ubiquinone/menaquinone biosynthesis C-methylase UbiE
MRQIVIDTYLCGKADLNDPEVMNDIENHVSVRLMDDRYAAVPWLDALMPLTGARILEIGCGTGSSTVALAEQGSHVMGVDINERSIQVARQRLSFFEGLNVIFEIANALELEEKFHESSFDFVIFFAALEHMTIDERLKALSAAWRLTKPDGLLCVVETPNRLWWYDGHTSHLPFFNWLPEEIALRYMVNSKRVFAGEYRSAQPGDPAWTIRLWREGLGASYHEFELALGRPVAEIDIVDSMDLWLMRCNPLYRMRYILAHQHFSRLLRKFKPGLPHAFSLPILNVAIRKRHIASVRRTTST